MDGFKNWFRGLRGKLLLMVILPVAVMIVTAVIALNNLKTQHDGTILIAKDRLPKITALLRMQVQAEAAVRNIWAGISNDGEYRRQKIEAAYKAFDEFSKEYEALSAMPLVEQTRISLTAMYEDWKKVDTVGREILEKLKVETPAQDKVAREIIEAKFLQTYLKQLEAIKGVGKIIQGQVDLVIDNADKDATRIQTTMLLMGVISTIVLFVLGILIAHLLAKSLSSVSTQVSTAGSQVSTASEQLSTASQSLSSGATESASSLEETVSSLEELSSIVKMNADNAKEAASLAQQSTKSAEEGESEIKSLISAMSDITNSSKKIEEIINVIDDIAFQTNLLALNAAVEAARAGEQGKGFAVVAEEVRNLAQRSASAAKDINTLIKDAVHKTDHGAKIADQSGSVLSEIVASIKKVSDLNSEIASASAEQARGISQISKAMNELDTATQRNAAAAEEVAASSEELSAQAISLQGMVSDLTHIVEGTSNAGPSDYRSHQGGHAPLRVVHGGASKPRQHSAGRPAASMGSSKPSSDSVIPFDEDVKPANKVGNVEGF
ncbi:MAG: hypothetical protein BroJett040_02340 [Oligoflexia bacterium]|nr:MAG: hypothetical protein BroJett040_02340 [Oligoflexia bacterium]